MDFGIGFLSNNVMLPIIDFFYGIVPSYGLAIVALTLIIRFALYPLSAGSIRNMRKMRIVQPLMQKRMAEIKEKHKDNPQKQQEEMVNVQKEFGNPLAGCLPLVLQMPVLLALFATLRGSPFSGANYSVNLQIFPSEQIERIQPQAFATAPQNIYIADGERTRVTAILPAGNKLAVGEKTKIQYQTIEGKPFQALLAEHPESHLVPEWKVMKGEERVKIDAQGNIEALEPGDVTIQGSIPGLAAEKGFLFIQALGRVGATNPDGQINWDIVSMILFFGVSLYVSQMISGQNSSGGNPQQDTVNKITPVIFSGMFLFFPLPAGVLMYMVIGNIFQTAQTYILSREPLPEGLQEIVATQEKETAAEQRTLPFEPKSSKKKTTG
ncbi:membrane protein insertase YidC [Nodularia sphaerocarpa]|uniref:membrane protein insertase YidC n=1 Tax=Nodularia sphaerocarpa TaxID=137816 RepID=UPI001EFBFA50|nr:membrane protein insertase YidC [Nodularia sphaerocarpa]MDB9375993.1 membrane protein insertase YidC [Nodularia sphaerocarpa CS-585]MDB9379547.1 membrane protein insertase YidC [Nodularia sphaerocarpa CS-585A2]ULP72135.1 Membrane protein insertase YidC [Nodularia sphaerocarpa UHCC 0038]